MSEEIARILGQEDPSDIHTEMEPEKADIMKGIIKAAFKNSKENEPRIIYINDEIKKSFPETIRWSIFLVENKAGWGRLVSYTKPNYFDCLVFEYRVIIFGFERK